jgi:hypothetical protein
VNVKLFQGFERLAEFEVKGNEGDLDRLAGEVALEAEQVLTSAWKP